MYRADGVQRGRTLFMMHATLLKINSQLRRGSHVKHDQTTHTKKLSFGAHRCLACIGVRSIPHPCKARPVAYGIVFVGLILEPLVEFPPRAEFVGETTMSTTLVNPQGAKVRHAVVAPSIPPWRVTGYRQRVCGTQLRRKCRSWMAVPVRSCFLIQSLGIEEQDGSQNKFYSHQTRS